VFEPNDHNEIIYQKIGSLVVERKLISYFINILLKLKCNLGFLKNENVAVIVIGATGCGKTQTLIVS
jgi:hypothetical protein